MAASQLFPASNIFNNNNIAQFAITNVVSRMFAPDRFKAERIYDGQLCGLDQSKGNTAVKGRGNLIYAGVIDGGRVILAGRSVVSNGTGAYLTDDKAVLAAVDADGVSNPVVLKARGKSQYRDDGPDGYVGYFCNGNDGFCFWFGANFALGQPVGAHVVCTGVNYDAPPAGGPQALTKGLSTGWKYSQFEIWALTAAIPLVPQPDFAAENANLKQELLALNQLIGNKDAEIAIKNMEITAKTAENTHLQTLLREAQTKIDRLTKTNADMKTSVVDCLLSNVASATSAQLEVLVSVLSINLVPNTIVSLDITSTKILNAETAIDFSDDYDQNIALPLTHLYSVVKHIHRNKALPPNKPISEWIANEKKMHDVAAKFAAMGVTEETFVQLAPLMFCRDVGLSTKAFAALQNEFSASRGETFLLSRSS